MLANEMIAEVLFGDNPKRVAAGPAIVAIITGCVNAVNDPNKAAAKLAAVAMPGARLFFDQTPLFCK